jgi:hypothetical protein
MQIKIDHILGKIRESDVPELLTDVVLEVAEDAFTLENAGEEVKIKIKAANVVKDPSGEFSDEDDGVVVKNAGKYVVFADLSLNAATSIYMKVGVMVNGATQASNQSNLPLNRCVLTVPLSLEAEDIITFWALISDRTPVSNYASNFIVRRVG